MFEFLKKYTKVILEPIKYSKVSFGIFFLMQIFDGFQSVFVVVIMSKLIEAVEIGNEAELYFWVRIFIITFVIKLIISIFEDSLYSNIDNDIFAGLSEKYLKKYVNLDNTSVEVYGTGKMNNIIFSGIHSICYGLLNTGINVFVEIFAIIYVFVLIFIKVPNIYYFLGFVVLFFIVIFLFGKGLHKVTQIRKETKENYLEIERHRVKIFMSKFEIFQNHKIESESRKIKKLYDENKKLRFKGNLNKNLWQSGSEIILNGFYIFIFLAIGVGVISGNYSIANFTLLIWVFQIISRYTWQIRGYMREFLKSFIHIEKLIDVFDNIPKYKDTSNLPNFQFKNGDIEFKNITFFYKEGTNVLENFNLKLSGGKKYAFVGESGGGKSTLMKLLASYISPNSGEILIDNQDISKVNLKSFYKNIGYLTQEPSVFDGTIIENLLYALDYEPDSKKIEEVIKLSKCEFIKDLPNCLETEIGEKGIKLSGGQKQRLAIAKIMLKNPKIILLDEPTSALDSFNEEQISLAFKNLFKNKTVLIIAHRLQTVKTSDMIYFIEDGKVKENGNHKELLKQKGEYFKMIELQSGF